MSQEYEALLITDFQKTGNELDQVCFEEENEYFYELTAGINNQNYELILPQECLNQNLTNHKDNYNDLEKQKNETQNNNVIYVNEKLRDDTTCLICFKVLSSMENLDNHMITRHKPKEFFCDNCSKKFKSKNNLRLHMQHHRKYFEVECQACHRKYKSIQSLRYHLRQHFESYDCNFCHLKFDYKKLLNSHIAAVHDQNLRLKCSFCSRTFNRSDLRDTHERMIHQNGEILSKYICKKCGESFDYRSDLANHSISNHFKGKIYSCVECGKKFKKKTSLDLHLNVHYPKFKFPCELCKKTFTYRTNLDKHHKLGRCKGQREGKNFIEELSKEQVAEIAKQQLLEMSKNQTQISTNPKNEPICMEFHMDNLLQDISIEEMDFDDDATYGAAESIFKYTNEDFFNFESFKPSIIDKNENETLLVFTCDVCNMKFQYKNSLIQHMIKSHWIICSKNNVKVGLETEDSIYPKFKCTRKNCNFESNSFSSLNRHLKAHNPIKPFQCEECGKEFKRRPEMTIHKKFVHSKYKTYVNCEICDKIILERSLKSHIINQHTDKVNFKPFACEICGKRERYEKTLQRHINSVHNPKSRGVIYYCSECPASFLRLRDLNEHSFRHFNGVILSCDICERQFKRKNDLRVHKKIHDESRLHCCSKCNLTFKTKGGLNKHISIKHKYSMYD